MGLCESHQRSSRGTDAQSSSYTAVDVIFDGWARGGKPQPWPTASSKPSLANDRMRAACEIVHVGIATGDSRPVNEVRFSTRHKPLMQPEGKRNRFRRLRWSLASQSKPFDVGEMGRTRTSVRVSNWASPRLFAECADV